MKDNFGTHRKWKEKEILEAVAQGSCRQKKENFPAIEINKREEEFKDVQNKDKKTRIKKHILEICKKKIKVKTSIS